MNPNDSQPLNPNDYLNQIAPQTTNNKFDFLKQKPILIGLISLAVLLIIITFAAFASSISNNINPIDRLAARLVSTQSTVTSATANLKSSELRALNSSLSLYLTDTILTAKPIFAKSNVNIDKLDKKATTAESNTEMLGTLEDARLNAIYDNTYAREMSYQLDNVLTLMQQIYKSTGDSELKSFLSDSINNLTPTQKQFANFNDTEL